MGLRHWENSENMLVAVGFRRSGDSIVVAAGMDLLRGGRDRKKLYFFTLFELEGGASAGLAGAGLV